MVDLRLADLSEKKTIADALRKHTKQHKLSIYHHYPAGFGILSAFFFASAFQPVQLSDNSYP